MKKYIFEFIFHRSKFLSHWVKYWFQLLTLAVFLRVFLQVPESFVFLVTWD